MKKIIFATHNQGKIKEIREILAPLGFEILSSDDLDLPDIEETGTTFEENAKLKAVSIATLKGIPCLADDSGLCVDCLNGRPGVYSARYAPNRDFKKAIEMLLEEMKASHSSSRFAHFSCVIVLAYPDGHCIPFSGRVDGQIALTPQGSSGFGFDPIFIPDGYQQTFAELGAEIKNKISHRGRALNQLIDYISQKGL